MQLKLRSSKRPNYFTGQLLGEEDFQAEQGYLLNLQRRHEGALHTWGVIDGLEVDRQDDSTVLLRPGSAIDSLGRNLSLESPQTLPLKGLTDNATVYLTIGYEEGFEEPDRSTDNAENYTRLTEFMVLRDATEVPAADGSVLTLAKIQLSGTKISAIDTSMRQIAGARLGPASVHTREIAAGAVTIPKLAPELRSGWVRLPFKPSSFAEPEVSKTAVDFSIGVTKTYCDPRGAKGTMSIPTPVFADRLKTFVIAGERNEGALKLELHRCGWDVAHNAHERTQLLQEQVPKGSPFLKSFTINKALDPSTHAVAIYVEATGECNISLIAAEFEWLGSKGPKGA